MESLLRLKLFRYCNANTLSRAFICFTVIALYGPFISNGLVFDDTNLLVTQDLFEYASTPISLQPRHFPYFTLGFVEVLFGQIEAHRILSLALHFVCACVVYRIARHLLEELLPERCAVESRFGEGMSPTLVALFVSLWFAVSPAAVYGAGYLIQRTIVCATLFSLLATWFYMAACKNGGVRNVGIAAFFYSAAVFSKEHAVLHMLAVLPLSFLFQAKITTHLKRGITYCVMCTPAALWLIVFNRHIAGNLYEPNVSQIIGSMSEIHLLQEKYGAWSVSGLFQLNAFSKYFFAWAIPRIDRMSIDIRVDFVQLWFSGEVFAWATLTIAAVIAALLMLRSGHLKALFGCGLLYAFILFLTEMVAVRFQEPFVLYRSYLWSLGYVLMLSALLSSIPRRFGLIPAVVILVICFVGANDRLRSLSSEEKTWNDAAEKIQNNNVPGAERIFHNRGLAYLKNKKYEAARADFSQAIAQNSNAYYSFYARGIAQFKLENYSGALSDFKHSASIKNEYGPAHFGMGSVLYLYGCVDLAKSAFLESEKHGVVMAQLQLSQIQQGIEKQSKSADTNLKQKCSSSF